MSAQRSAFWGLLVLAGTAGCLPDSAVPALNLKVESNRMRIRLTTDEAAEIKVSLNERADFLRKEFKGLEKDADKLDALAERIRTIEWNEVGD